ncbi:MAG: AAA family ATPase [Nitrososphaerota archaeon]|nr:AAA family ATPase [Nitrososphaerota archaeon]MDG6930496.1 AAA family ATPase [Nitrososphaerota archaeon]
MAKKIFADSSRLLPSYVPQELPYRETALNDLENLFTDSLNEKSFAVQQIVGDVGTGKTVTMFRFAQNTVQKYGKKFGIRYSYINPRQHGATRLLMFRQLAYQLAPETYSTSLSAEELLLETLKALERLNRIGILLIDEIDFALKKSREPIIYNLTRLNESMPSGRIMIPVVVISSRTMNFRDELDRAELSSLGNRVMFFERYNSEQVFNILLKRASESLNVTAYNENIIRYIADITSRPPVYGDIRYALDMLFNAGRLAESQGSDTITTEHIRTVMSITSPFITQEDLELLSPELKLVLLSVARTLKIEGESYTSLDKIVEMHKEVCNAMNIREIGLKEFVRALQELDDRGLVDVKGVAKIGISGAPVQNLDDFLTYMISRLNLNEKQR